VKYAIRQPRAIAPGKEIAASLYIHPRVRTHKASAAVAQAQGRSADTH